MLSLNGILSAKLGVTLNSVGFFQFPHLHSESITESKKRFCTNSTMLVDLMLTLQWCFIDMFCVYFPQVFFCCYSRECWQRSCLCSVLRCSEAECNDFSSNSNSFSKGPWFKSLSQPLNPSALFDLSETCQEKYETDAFSKQRVTSKIQCNAEKLKQTITFLDFFFNFLNSFVEIQKF